MVVVLGSGPGRSSCLVILILTQIFSQDKLDFHALQSDMRNMLNLQAEHNISTEIKYYQISDGTKQIFLYWQRAGYFSIFSRPSCGSLHVVQTLVSSQHHQGGGSRYSAGLFIVWVSSPTRYSSGLLPTEADFKQIAYNLIRLEEVYGLDFTKTISQSHLSPALDLGLEDFLSLGKVAFENLNMKGFHSW